MVRNLFLSLFTGVLCCGLVVAQETEIVTIMQYNLLNYNNSTNTCDGTNNSANDKDGYLKTIFDFTEPEILLVNELGSNFTNGSRILDNAINTDGRTSYWQGGFSNNGFSNIVNQIFYDTNKFILSDQDEITQDLNGGNIVRLIDVYTLYYKDSNLHAGSDTVFLTILLAHLKAGSTTSDRDQRDRATEAVMDYLDNTQHKGNLIFAGDFNVQSSSEASFQNLVNHINANNRFHDPIDDLGDWNNNSNFAAVHTQSTRLNNTSGGCFSGGGMDDRYDFILVNQDVLDNLYGVEYIPNSYNAVGQDGMRFNQTIISPSNFTVSSAIGDALHDLSDHLPVRMSVRIELLPVGTEEPRVEEARLRVLPAGSDQLELQLLETETQGDVSIALYDLQGRLLEQGTMNGLRSLNTYKTGQLNSGVFVVRIADEQGLLLSRKLIKI